MRVYIGAIILFNNNMHIAHDDGRIAPAQNDNMI